jgi:hypothetical protein
MRVIETQSISAYAETIADDGSRRLIYAAGHELMHVIEYAATYLDRSADLRKGIAAVEVRLEASPEMVLARYEWR